MIIIKTTDDLLTVAANQAPSEGCARCIRQCGEDVTYFGQFGATPDTSRDLWIIVVHSPHGKEWILGIRAADKIGEYTVCQIKSETNIPWGHWRGSRTGTNLLVDGTTPEQSNQLKSLCLKCQRTFLPDGLISE